MVDAPLLIKNPLIRTVHQEYSQHQLLIPGLRGRDDLVRSLSSDYLPSEARDMISNFYGLRWIIPAVMADDLVSRGYRGGDHWDVVDAISDIAKKYPRRRKVIRLIEFIRFSETLSGLGIFSYDTNFYPDNFKVLYE